MTTRMDKIFLFLMLQLFLSSDFVFCSEVEDNVDLEISCNDEPDSETDSKEGWNVDSGIIVVSTIDGNLIALDPKSGVALWSRTVDSLGLISSSLEKLEVVENGKIMRLIPSLDGSIFKLNKEKLEPLPVTADSLLKSSSKVGDNLSVIGEKGKKVSGFDLLTGMVSYECNSKGCVQFKETSVNDDVLVIEQYTQSVIAVDSRKGASQWNFRVVELHLTIATGVDEDSFEQTADSQDFVEKQKNALITDERYSEERMFMDRIKIAMNAGYVGVFNDGSKTFDWFQKLSSPIVDVWYVKNKMVYALDPFDDKSQFIFLNAESGKSVILGLLVGSFQNQLFIKLSKTLKSEANSGALTRKTEVTTQMPHSPQISVHVHGSEILWTDSQQKSLMDLETEEVLATFDHGIYYYLNYTVPRNSSQCFVNSSSRERRRKFLESEDMKTWIAIVVTTFVITVTSTVICFRLFMKSSNNDSKESEPIEINIIESAPSTPTEPEFISRFVQDFDMIKVLGKGGFGIVVEARNKIDDCSYAVKRIQYFDDSFGENMFKKVMREVKALAVLDHPGIVRYFNAWTEIPPEGWQEKKDRELKLYKHGNDSPFASNTMSPSPSSTHVHQIDAVKRAMNANPLQLANDFDSSSFNFGSPCFNNFDESKSGASEEDAEINMMETDTKSNTMSPSTLPVHAHRIDAVKKAINSNPLQLANDFDSSFDNFSSPSFNNYDEVQAEFDKSEEDTESNMETDTKSTDCGCPTQVSATEGPCNAFLYIQMQLCCKDSLRDWLSKNMKRNHDKVMSMFSQIVDAVDYLHQCGLMHRDLKPSNIFFSLDGNIKIGDFGLVTTTTDALSEDSNAIFTGSLSSIKTMDIGTDLYMSPEQRVRKIYDSKTDIFSLGIIFFEMLVPFDTGMERSEVICGIRNLRFPKKFTEEFRQEHKLVKQLLQANPDFRPSASEIKNHHLLMKFFRKA